MNNNFYPMQLIQMIRQGKNPQELVMSVLAERAKGNPFMGNLLSLAQKGDMQAIQQIARNTMQSQGKNFDTEFQKFRNNLGL